MKTLVFSILGIGAGLSSLAAGPVLFDDGIERGFQCPKYTVIAIEPPEAVFDCRETDGAHHCAVTLTTGIDTLIGMQFALEQLPDVDTSSGFGDWVLACGPKDTGCGFMYLNWGHAVAGSMVIGDLVFDECPVVPESPLNLAEPANQAVDAVPMAIAVNCR